eukprot:Amastigsp_a511689_29.p2 type:complete len:247 gc:universal Amastigsp_a511689_29:1081-341(-)
MPPHLCASQQRLDSCPALRVQEPEPLSGFVPACGLVRERRLDQHGARELDLEHRRARGSRGRVRFQVRQIHDSAFAEHDIKHLREVRLELCESEPLAVDARELAERVDPRVDARGLLAHESLWLGVDEQLRELPIERKVRKRRPRAEKEPIALVEMPLHRHKNIANDSLEKTPVRAPHLRNLRHTLVRIDLGLRMHVLARRRRERVGNGPPGRELSACVICDPSLRIGRLHEPLIGEVFEQVHNES